MLAQTTRFRLSIREIRTAIIKYRANWPIHNGMLIRPNLAIPTCNPGTPTSKPGAATNNLGAARPRYY